jgi:hypothetical protein
MKTLFRSMLLAVAGLVISQIGMAQAPAGAPVGATGLCKDGTYYTGASKKGACRGHQGVKDWYASATPAPSSSPTAPVAHPAPAPAAAPAPVKAAPVAKANTSAPAPGGGSGQVWLNTSTNVYHCQGTKYYGTTKAGKYMTEAEAKAKGARPDHGKPCS